MAVSDHGDRELMQRLVRHDQAALAELYDRYANLIYSMAVRVLGSPTLAEETTQDVFMEVWNRPTAWDASRGRLSSWLLTVTRYTAIDRLRREKRSPDVAEFAPDESAPSDLARDPMWEDGQALRGLLARLPTEQAQVIELAFFYGLTHSEMAESLGLALGTVKTRVRLGLQKLRELWES